MTDNIVSEKPRGMETLALLRDECSALASALARAMSGYTYQELAELRRRARELAGSLGLFGGFWPSRQETTGSIDEQIEKFLDEDAAALAEWNGALRAELYRAGRELEDERIAGARLRDELKARDEEHSRTVVALESARSELESLRGQVGRP
jgi:hypothetical protein